jgi:hypothetical protein
MLIQWPDRFYHTNQDTLDKVDPKMLRLVGVLASTYAYFLANADDDAVGWLLSESISLAKMEVIEFFQSKLRSGSGVQAGELRMLRELILRRVDSFKCFRGRKFNREKSQLRKFVQSELKSAVRLGLVEQLDKRTMNRWEREAADIVPIRVYRAPADLRSNRHLLTRKEKDKLHRLRKKYSETFSLLPVLSQFWMDGRRTLLDIARLVEFETSSKNVVRFLVSYFRILSRIGLIQFRDEKE